MNIPKKIHPDRIKDSIVEIRFTCELPLEVQIGVIYKALDDTYFYTNRPFPKNQSGNQPFPDLKEFNILSGNYLFFNDKIKFSVQQNKIIFNCLNEYLGWEIYSKEIEKVLSQIQEIKDITSFIRVGIRYISEYSEIDLKKCVKFDFTFGMPDIKSDTYLFNSEFRMHPYRVVLKLHHTQLPIEHNKNLKTELISSIDIDVMEDFSTKSFNELLDKINQAHKKEKEIFFNILREDFLKTLKPEY